MNYSRYSFPDGHVVCPYNNSHVLGNLKAFSHLDKCRKQHPELAQKIQICPYNQSHHIPSHEMKDHFKFCREYGASKSYDYDTSAHRVNAATSFQEGPTSTTTVSTDKEEMTESQATEEDLSEWM